MSGSRHLVTVAGKHILIDFGGFSAHADRDELVNWYCGSWAPEHTFLAHGEDGAREALAGMLRAQGRRVEPPTLHASYSL